MAQKKAKTLRMGLRKAMLACGTAALCIQSALAAGTGNNGADTIWTRFSTIMADVYGQLVGISTIVGVTAASVALLSLALALSASAVSPETAEASSILPVDVIVDQEAQEIHKVYDLSPSVDPSAIPREDFERDGLRYACSDILREVVMGDETQTLTQTETVESKNKELETILALLPQEKDVATEDGFSGTLYLNLNSLRTEVSGYGSCQKPGEVTEEQIAQSFDGRVCCPICGRFSAYRRAPQEEERT